MELEHWHFLRPTQDQVRRLKMFVFDRPNPNYLANSDGCHLEQRQVFPFWKCSFAFSYIGSDENLLANLTK